MMTSFQRTYECSSPLSGPCGHRHQSVLEAYRCFLDHEREAQIGEERYVLRAYENSQTSERLMSEAEEWNNLVGTNWPH